MSLVNDMLRDLDQRRKESDGPAARIKLTPAGDYRRQEKRNYVPVIAVGLVAVAGVLAYAWVEMHNGETTRQLAVPIASDTTTAVAVEESGEIDQIPAPQPITAPPVVAVATPDSSATTDNGVAESLDELLARSSENLSADSAVVSEPTASAVSSSLVTDSTSGSSTALVTTNTTTQSVTVPSITSSNINVRSQNPISAPAEIKGVTEPTPELRDTLVVQEALRLIANNQTTDAYTKLEQHLIDNPYAHQSRETYAKFLMNQGDADSANALVSAGLELAPNHSGFKKVKARLLIGGGDIQSAVNLLESRAPSVRDDGEYHEILASAQLAIRDYEGAVLSYTGLIQLDQTQGRWWYGFAAAQDALGNATAAQQAYTRAMEIPNLSASLRRRSQDRLTALGR